MVIVALFLIFYLQKYIFSLEVWKAATYIGPIRQKAYAKGVQLSASVFKMPQIYFKFLSEQTL